MLVVSGAALLGTSFCMSCHFAEEIRRGDHNRPSQRGRILAEELVPSKRHSLCGPATIRTTYQLKDQHLDPSSVTPNVLSANLGKRWRAERNFWIAFITFTLWWCVPAQHA